MKKLNSKAGKAIRSFLRNILLDGGCRNCVLRFWRQIGLRMQQRKDRSYHFANEERETRLYRECFATYFSLIGLRLRGEPMDPPYFAEHGAKREGETGRHRPCSSLADYQKLPRSHKPTVNPYTEDGEEAAYYADQHYGIGGGMRRVYNSEK